MKHIRLIPAIALLLGLSAFTLVNSTEWKVAEDFEIKFTSKDPSGVFTELNGDIIFDANNLEASRFDLIIPVSSINTGKGMQNRHANSAKWFDSETYPNIQFTSKEFKKTSAGYTVSGTMKIKGKEKAFDIPFTFTGNVFEASFSVNRNDFGIGKEGGKVPAEMKIDVRVPVTS